MKGAMHLTFEILRKFVYALVEVRIPRRTTKSSFLVATSKIQHFHKKSEETMHLTFEILRTFVHAFVEVQISRRTTKA